MRKTSTMIIIIFLFFSTFLMLAAQVKATDWSLVGYWKFDEGTGNIAHDSSGNGNDGTIYGATWTTGKQGAALRFDGIDDYVEVQYDPVLDLTTGLRIEAWVKVYGATEDYQVIVAKWYPGPPSGGSYVLEFQPDGITPWLVLYTWSRFNTASSVTVPFGSWAHIVGKYHGAVAKIYVNEQLTGSQEVTGLIGGGDQLICFGAHSPIAPGDRNWFNGVIDEIAIYMYMHAGVGGVVVPVHKFGLLAPYMGLASTIVAAITATAIYVKRVKRRKER